MIAVQLEYSLLERTVEGELLPMARAHGIGVLPWGPLRRVLVTPDFHHGHHSGNANNEVDTDLIAVRAGRVYFMDANATLSRPGPRMVDGLEDLAQIIQPELFPCSASTRRWAQA